MVGEAGNDRKPERSAVAGGQLPGDPFMPQQVGTVGADIDHQPVIVERHRLQQAGARRGFGSQLPDPVAVLAQAQLASGAQHSLRGFTSELPLFDAKAAGKRGTDRRKGILPSRRHVRRATYHVAPLGRSVVHQTDPEPVGVGMRPHLLDQSDEDVAQTGVEWLDGIHRRAQHGQPVSDVLDLQPAAKEVLAASAGRRS